MIEVAAFPEWSLQWGPTLEEAGSSVEAWTEAMKLYGDLLEIQTPRDSTTIMYSDQGGSGKTFLAVNIMAINALRLRIHTLTNIKFVRAVEDKETGEVRIDKKIVSPHPRVRYVSDMVQFWYNYALILKEDPLAYVVFAFDEINKFLPRDDHFSPVAKALRAIWTENRKYRLIPQILGQQMQRIPRPLLPTIHWYISKSAQITEEYNSRCGTDYGHRQLAFVIYIPESLDLDDWHESDFHLEDVKDIIYVDRGPWTQNINRPVAGTYYYDSRGSGNIALGELNGDPDWHKKLLDELSQTSSFGVADAILGFFEKRTDGKSTDWLSQGYRTNQARMFYSYHLANGVLNERKEPVLEVMVKGKRQLAELEVNSSNLSRMFDISESTIRYQVGREKKDAKKAESREETSAEKTAQAGDDEGKGILSDDQDDDP